MIYREKFNVNQFWELMVKEIFSFVQKYDQKAPKSTPEESLENLKEKKKDKFICYVYAMVTNSTPKAIVS